MKKDLNITYIRIGWIIMDSFVNDDDKNKLELFLIQKKL